ncbi:MULTISPECIES: hypothetical protein [unclassified Dysgonomonas]|jgi:hypothetical protein|uniref:hypothetical protein n=1 Tax=unclassified Dysgonomonas TaxID=2630389 RepID=UPI0025C6F26C|nr:MULTISPECIES: hypothetical protein [unclassified Dysgonomonas]MDR2002781.1 hypothetical protein [Prevotella sp.]HMM03476.1 hypothetical protein [Dysgonomonas sp.]
MKTINKIIQMLVVVMLLPIGFTGCNDDDNETINPGGETEVPAFTLGQESIRVKVGVENKITVDVKEGGGEYDAFILDANIAKAEIVDGVVKVEGVANGQTSLIVSDKYSRYRKVPVSVYTTDKLQLSHETFDLVTVLGNSKTLTANVVLGNGGYEVTSNNPAVTVSVNEEGVISMTAVSKKIEFTAIVTVTDCTGLSEDIAVTVTASMNPFTDAELETIMLDNTRRYFYNGSKTDASYYTYLNEVTSQGKQRYGWDYYSYYWYKLEFKGGKDVGTKEDAVFDYYYYSAGSIVTPVTMRIIKNDGTNIWGIFSYINDEQEKLYTGYFCAPI